jgi:hypothetical protein
MATATWRLSPPSCQSDDGRPFGAKQTFWSLSVSKYHHREARKAVPILISDRLRGAAANFNLYECTNQVVLSTKAHCLAARICHWKQAGSFSLESNNKGV